MVARAQQSIGIKYLLGGNNPLRGLDCSALIRHIVSAFDITLPRTAQEQARAGREIPKDRSQMKPGDLLTFGKGSRITHIGMYIGEGRFIHASTSKRRVIESSLDVKSSSLVREWKGVRRLVDGDLVAARYDSMFAFLDSLGVTGGDSSAASPGRR
jgi:cell wall-associated NlpC family hydrolase